MRCVGYCKDMNLLIYIFTSWLALQAFHNSAKYTGMLHKEEFNDLTEISDVGGWNLHIHIFIESYAETSLERNKVNL